jgi:hypothetical protein
MCKNFIRDFNFSRGSVCWYSCYSVIQGIFYSYFAQTLVSNIERTQINISSLMHLPILHGKTNINGAFMLAMVVLM